VNPTSFSLETAFLLLHKRVASHEITLLHFDQPTEVIASSGVGRVVEIVAVERHPHLEPQRIARAESDGDHFARGRSARSRSFLPASAGRYSSKPSSPV